MAGRMPSATLLVSCRRQLREALVAAPPREGEGGDYGVVAELWHGYDPSKDQYRHRVNAERDADTAMQVAIRNGELQIWIWQNGDAVAVSHEWLNGFGHEELSRGVVKLGRRSVPPSSNTPWGRETFEFFGAAWIRDADWNAFLSRVISDAGGRDQNGPGRPNKRNEALGLYYERVSSGTSLPRLVEEAKAIHALLAKSHAADQGWSYKIESIRKAISEMRRADKTKTDLS